MFWQGWRNWLLNFLTETRVHTVSLQTLSTCNYQTNLYEKVLNQTLKLLYENDDHDIGIMKLVNNHKNYIFYANYVLAYLNWFWI